MEERIEQHVFRFIERELFNYQVNKRLVDSFDRESQDVSIASTLGKEGDRFSINQITNPTGAKAMRLAAMAGKVERARWYVQAIDDVLGTLPEEDKTLVELKYFNGMLNNTGVAACLKVSDREFYRRRYGVVEKFGIRMGMI